MKTIKKKFVSLAQLYNQCSNRIMRAVFRMNGPVYSSNRASHQEVSSHICDNLMFPTISWWLNRWLAQIFFPPSNRPFNLRRIKWFFLMIQCWHTGHRIQILFAAQILIRHWKGQCSAQWHSLHHGIVFLSSLTHFNALLFAFFARYFRSFFQCQKFLPKKKNANSMTEWTWQEKLN